VGSRLEGQVNPPTRVAGTGSFPSLNHRYAVTGRTPICDSPLFQVHHHHLSLPVEQQLITLLSQATTRLGVLFRTDPKAKSSRASRRSETPAAWTCPAQLDRVGSAAPDRRMPSAAPRERQGFSRAS
jgi:hypothetical protein